jgi:hypothetical protein
MWTQKHIYYSLKFAWSQCLKLLALLLFNSFFCWSWRSLKLFAFFFFMVVLLVLVFKVIGPPIHGHLVGPSALKLLMTSSSLWCSEVIHPLEFHGFLLVFVLQVVGPSPRCAHFVGLGVLKIFITSSCLWCSKVVGPPPFVGLCYNVPFCKHSSPCLVPNLFVELLLWPQGFSTHTCTLTFMPSNLGGNFGGNDLEPR